MPLGSIGYPHSGHIGRPAATISRVRLAKARAVPTGMRTSSISSTSVGSSSSRG